MSIACSGPPALIDVAHQFDVRPDRLAHHAHAAHFVGRRRIARQRHLGLHLLEALLHQDLRRPLRLTVGQAAPQRAGRIGRHPIPMAAQKLPQRLFQRLALDVPQRDVDGRRREGENPARPAGIAGAGAQFRGHRLDPQRIHADRQFGEFIDRPAQAAGHPAAVKRDRDALDAAVGAQFQRDDGAFAAFLLGHVGQRIVFGDGERDRLEAGDFHGRFLYYCPGMVQFGASAGDRAHATFVDHQRRGVLGHRLFGGEGVDHDDIGRIADRDAVILQVHQAARNVPSAWRSTRAAGAGGRSGKHWPADWPSGSASNRRAA